MRSHRGRSLASVRNAHAFLRNRAVSPAFGAIHTSTEPVIL